VIRESVPQGRPIVVIAGNDIDRRRDGREQRERVLVFFRRAAIGNIARHDDGIRRRIERGDVGDATPQIGGRVDAPVGQLSGRTDVKIAQLTDQHDATAPRSGRLPGA
jgi:hypothetical protein